MKRNMFSQHARKERNRQMRTTLAFNVALLTACAGSVSAQESLDRTILPITPPKAPTYTELDARNVTPPPRFEVKPPAGAPNVVIVLIDDVGFGASSAFGGPVSMPTIDRLAQDGLRYNRFHTTALSSPTRVALQTGRNHHTGEMGSISETATAFPGNRGMVSESVASVAEMLRLNGYNTAAFGKWHETPTWELNVSGPFDRWPTNRGYEKFYGFLGAESNQWSPLLYDGTARVELPNDPNYHLMTDMTDKTVEWLKFQKAITPDKPFMIYFAPGATHSPHHVPKEWIARWQGKFDQGWDKLREETLARQIAMGIVPPDTKLAPKPAFIKDWETLSDDEKRLFTRQIEVFAAYLEFTDYEVGRVIQAIQEVGALENTLIFYIVGDNGTSAEGSANGMFNENTYFNKVQEHVSDLVTKLDLWGSPYTYPHMAAGWAVALDAPFAWTKQVAADFGGIRNGMAVYWPKGITAKNEIRSQFTHAIDVAPTILEAVGVPEPTVVNGVTQIPMEGTSLMYSFNQADAEDRHVTQYFEMYGNRAIYDHGWFARAIHRAPWDHEPRHSLQEDTWELYDVRSDFSLVNNLAKSEPAKLEELQALFMKEAEKYHVLPLDDRMLERGIPAVAGRPDVMGNRTSLTLSDGMDGITGSAFISVKNRSHSITAEIEVPESGANGIILAVGGRFGGYALYVKDGVPAYDYNFVGMIRTTISGKEPLAPGKATIRFEFAYDGGGLGKGGAGTLFVNDQKVAEGRIEHTTPITFSLDETADVGIDLGTPVVEAIGAEQASKFTGKIPKITIAVQEMPKADKAQEDKANKELVQKKAMSE